MFFDEPELDKIDLYEIRQKSDSIFQVDYLLGINDRAGLGDCNDADFIYPSLRTGNEQWDDMHGMLWGESYLESYYDRIYSLSESNSNEILIGPTWPGFDDREWNMGLDHWIDRQDSLVYQKTWQLAKENKKSLDWIWIESWNTFTQGTHIEPSVNYGYAFLDQTRRYTAEYKRQKGLLPFDELSLILPQHLYQARVAIELDPDRQNIAAPESGLDYLFSRQPLQGISLLDQIAGLAMKPLSLTKMSATALEITWQPAVKASQYILWMSKDRSDFKPASLDRPDSTDMGKTLSYLVTGLDPDTDIHLVVTAANQALGPYANSGWYENSRTGASIRIIDTSIDEGETIPADKANTLVFVSGTPTYAKGDDVYHWENAIDGIVTGWQGTTLARGLGDIHGPAYGVFRFNDYGLYQFNYVHITVDNGAADDGMTPQFHTRTYELWVSSSGTAPQDFKHVLTFHRKQGGESFWFPLHEMVTARYIKLILVAPDYLPGGWRQIVEFEVHTHEKRGAVPANEKTIVQKVPSQTALLPVYPNPFNASATIQYELAEKSPVLVEIYNVRGQHVETLIDAEQSAGHHRLKWDAQTNSNGVYFIRMKTNKEHDVQRLLLLK